jgi:Tol biopolymer transport system component
MTVTVESDSDWSPYGSQLVFSGSEASDALQVYVMDPDRPEARRAVAYCGRPVGR